MRAETRPAPTRYPMEPGRVSTAVIRLPAGGGRRVRPRHAHLSTRRMPLRSRRRARDRVGLNVCWWSGVLVGGRRPKPEASTVAEEPAHGVQAPAEDVLAKRPNWQA